MRRLPLALAFLIAAAAAPPVQAQGWGGWSPCYGPCRPWMAPGWAGGPPPYARWRFGLAQGFAPGSWWSPRAVRWRRFAAWRDAAEGQAEAGAGPRFGGWVWRRPAPTFAMRPARPAVPIAEAARPVARRADEAVAAMPTGALRHLRRAPAPVPSRVLAAAAMFRREAAPAPRLVRIALPLRPPSRAAEVAPPPRRPGGAPHKHEPAVQPASLRSQPIVVQPAASGTRPPEVQPQSPPPAAAPAADVPAAPLD